MHCHSTVASLTVVVSSKETHGIRRELSRLEQRETDVSDTSDFGEELGQVSFA